MLDTMFIFLYIILKLWYLNRRKKTVVVSLWNELATNMGQELLDIANSSPIVAIKSLKVGDFQGKANFKLKIIGKCLCMLFPCVMYFLYAVLGISLSTISRSTVVVNPDIPEAKKLRSWYVTARRPLSPCFLAL